MFSMGSDVGYIVNKQETHRDYIETNIVTKGCPGFLQVFCNFLLDSCPHNWSVNMELLSGNIFHGRIPNSLLYDCGKPTRSWMHKQGGDQISRMSEKQDHYHLITGVKNCCFSRVFVVTLILKTCPNRHFVWFSCFVRLHQGYICLISHQVLFEPKNLI